MHVMGLTITRTITIVVRNLGGTNSNFSLVDPGAHAKPAHLDPAPSLTTLKVQPLEELLVFLNQLSATMPRHWEGFVDLLEST